MRAQDQSGERMKAIHRKFDTQYLSTQCSNCNWTYEQVGDESARELARKEAIAHVEKTGHKIWFVARTAECIESSPTGE